LGGTPTPSNGNSITRNTGAIWFLTSEDEWYKAAYYDPTLAGGSGGYWDYATMSNSAPTVATAVDIVGPTRGDISNPGANVANYFSGADWNSQNGNVTTVGSAGPLSDSYYGTADQSGNVVEWNEALILGALRGLRGGSWSNGSGSLLASIREPGDPEDSSNSNAGFRVATVPEPGTAVLGMIGCAFTLWWWRRRK
jgi:formylglycine-generating enzyme required for sulfatase activity